MADEITNTNLISKKNTGFPDYLDFEKLRSEGIDYIGRLSGKIWTDHNVHDPGITILEMLCYALLDLGYRTNLPEKDIFTRNPDDKSTDNNFFTAAKILGCNPLTITDYRKLLIDIEGVKNAWLEPATDKKDFCQSPWQNDPVGSFANNNDADPCVEFLNGLYHVYIDLEKDVEKEIENEDERDKYVKCIVNKVRTALMAHRNLCEDFVDIYVLCKQETGICADIELEENADAEKVYISIVEKLRAFFSPSPQFYTLQQLLDKQKPIEEIFAGRPYNITESHGFVDTGELDQLKLRKEIHLSDVYNVLFSTEGVKAVRSLRLQFCDKNQKLINDWKFHIPENHVPEFSVKCSGFQFTRQGMPVFIDVEKFEGLFEINFTQNEKILYKSPSPYLDTEISGGVYHTSLADYYSIQNEFPRVYGIAEGGLSEKASPRRKAQAYQLKAYLLFFDQLLANYLAQLKNIRNLFALSSDSSGEDHSYFINQLTTVPDLQKLLRFNVGGNDGNALGTEGSILIIPVNKTKLLTLKEQDKLKTLDIEKVAPYTFNTLAEQDTVISQVKDDLLYDQCQYEFVTKTNDCVFYYILTGSDEVALISRKYFKDQPEAKQHAVSVKYIAGFEENYRSFITTGDQFSFDIELNLLSFTKYLQLLIEDKELFYQRRQGFLNHLLARFAEQFTDYAILSFGFFNEQHLQAADIKNKEKFLIQYDDLSSNRGRAYDYLENNWNSNNVSGFEKKFKAISGIENRKQHSLCNFEVAIYDEQFAVNLKIAGTLYFTAEDKFDTREEALLAAKDLFAALNDKSNYLPEYIDHDEIHELKIKYAGGREAVFPVRYASKEEADKVAGDLSGLFREKDPAENILVSAWQYIPYLIDSTDKPVRRSVEAYTSDAEARGNALKVIKRINDPAKWELLNMEINPGHLYRDANRTDIISFVDTDGFKIDVDNTIPDQPDKFRYSALDKGNRFEFKSANEFNSEKQARSDWGALLTFMTAEKNYEVHKDDADGKYLIRIATGNSVRAVSAGRFTTEKEALDFQQTVLNIVQKQQYFITVEKRPHRWKFNYQLGYEKDNLFLFESVNDYAQSTEAVTAAALFYKAIPAIAVKQTENALQLAPSKNSEKISAVKLNLPGNNIEPVKNAVIKLLDEQKEITELSGNPDPAAFSSSVSVDEISRQGLYVYRLLDKDRVPAFYGETFTNKDSAKSRIKEISEVFKTIPSYLKLCMGGDIIRKRKDSEKNVLWYHYQMKAINRFYISGQPVILFESTKGYPSEEEAEKAFLENYLMLVYLGSDAANYGEGKRISLTEILVYDADPCIKNDSIVFVPKETLEEFGTNAADELVKFLLTYPIRAVRPATEEFYNLFPCEKEKDDKIKTGDCSNEKDKDCTKEKEEWVYYFSLMPLNEKLKNWQSAQFYKNPDEAKKDFDFFLILLHYPGNYFTDCDPCSTTNNYRIYIREVLAESAERFPDEEQAWGKDGVQKFICVSQSEGAFHTYLRENDCCYSFYVACSRGIVYHPCKYDTAKKRNEAMLLLYKGLKGFIKKRSYQVEDNDSTFNLLNENGEAFAVIDVANRSSRCITDWISEAEESLKGKQNYTNEDGRVVLRNAGSVILARAVKPGIEVEEWKALLQSFVCYYPIVKSKNEISKQEQYCVEIKLPGFNTCEEDKAEEKPCGCGNEITEGKYECHIAWKGRCCFATCEAAEMALEAALKLLSNFRYYQPVFDCICASYGIAAQFSKLDTIPDENISHYWYEANIPLWQSSEIIAINPQCYNNPEAACEAVGRAKKMINSEGLHIVEHILLRPRCNPGDCQCRYYTERCYNKSGCNKFEWRDSDDDPCTDDNAICFIPGADPYSFIATVVLPAWPQRFRKKENRQLLENILYRETPAHVLLRILWLAPHDLCCFETKFKSWNRWLALKEYCIDNFDTCDFLEFLFDRNYECIPGECDFCKPCEDDLPRQKLCIEKTSDAQNDISIKYLNQINDLYCWENQDCKKYQFTGCERQMREPDNENPGILLRHSAITNDSGETIAPTLTGSEAKSGENKSAEMAAPGPVDKAALSKTKRQVVNSRMAGYRNSATEVLEKSKQNPVAAKVQSFLTDPKPSGGRLLKLTTEVLQDKLPKIKGIKALTKKQVYELLQGMICYYLDKIYFNGKDIEKLTELKKVLGKLSKENISLQGIYDHWNMNEVKQYEAELNGAEIKKLFRIKAK